MRARPVFAKAQRRGIVMFCVGGNTMLIQVHQHNIDHSDALETQARAAVETLAQRYAGRITRVDVFIEDVNSHKGGKDDQRCLMEAHIAGLTNIAAEARGRDPYLTVADAADKLARAIESRVDRANVRTPTT
jgi:ribosome-associated translation inhibitor RaiA